MKRMDLKEGLEALRQARFTVFEIERLFQLKRAYVENVLDQAHIDLSRLEFIRWLIAHGRLSVQTV